MGFNMATKETKKTVYRDSTDGQFTTKKDAEKNPKTTEKESVRTSPAKSKGKGK